MKYSYTKGIEELNRSLLIMGYNPSLTLKENFGLLREQTSSSEENPTGYADVKRGYNLEGQKTILTPDNRATYVPDGTKILQLADQEYYLSLLTSKSLRNWVSKEKGGLGNTQTGYWIPEVKDWSKIAKPNSVVKFQTPDGIIYNAIYTNPILDKITNPEDVYKLDPKPNEWKFKGYYNRDNKPFVPVKTPDRTGLWNFIEDNWEIIAQVAASIIVGILTAGQSLWIQALLQLGIDIAFVLKQLIIDKDHFGAFVSLVMSLIPVGSAALKFGVNGPLNFLKKYGKDLVKIKDKDAFKLFFESLKYDEQLLLTRALKQTPAEFKKLTNEAFVKGFQKAVNEKTIEIPKIPLKNLLWIKQVFVEGGISLTTGVGLTLAKAIYDKQQSENEINKKFTDPNKKMNLQLVSDKTNTSLDSLANLYNIK